MKKTILKIISIMTICVILIFNMCSFMSYDGTDSTSQNYRFVKPHLSPSVTVATSASVSNLNYSYFHTVPDVFGVTINSDDYDFDGITYKNSALDCGLSYLQVGTSLYDDVEYSPGTFYYDSQTRSIDGCRAEQVILFADKEMTVVTFRIENQYLRSEFMGCDWFTFELKPLRRNSTADKYTAYNTDEYSLKIDYEITIEGRVYQNMDTVYYNGDSYDICDIIDDEFSSFNRSIKDYPYIYINKLELTYYFNEGDTPKGFAYRSFISNVLDAWWRASDYFAEFSTPFREMKSEYEAKVEELEYKYQELLEGVQNEKALPLLFDGIYKVIHNTLTIFFNMDFFGAKLGSVVAILIGAAVVILILKVVL